ncbi:hypothetical protein OPKNFCMD_5524 [Methylobacterium crusticola]|uniref:Amidohydrolase-related domain-containing protein n=1 Tax=Methylobacterium crusticola TaxID=1697972 RepID=A0ABQ4R5M8_9HYPH|nr:amidohydrolase family protein [Methylobacterium crusticola]GJD52757.1 hypothetical protein OPKNFCMD_5524 [Methylobacterium crusticola]
MASRIYDGPVVDAHQHFWEPDRNPHPWLRPEARIPFRYGNYDAIKRRYLPDDYRRDAGPHRIAASVYVETEWDPADPIGETAYASGLAARHGLPGAIVAQAWLDRADAADVLARQAAFPLVRSVRHKPGGPARPEEAGRSRTLMSDPAWRAGFARLARHGLRFDLQTPWWNLDEAVELARDFPGTTIILNHAGLPAARDPASLAGWRAAMARLAGCPNVAVKVSGLGQPGQAWTPESNGPVVRAVIELFGAERAMFGSNFPVDSLCATLPEILGGMKAIAAPLPPAEQEAFFAGTARRVYALAPAG